MLIFIHLMGILVENLGNIMKRQKASSVHYDQWGFGNQQSILVRYLFLVVTTAVTAAVAAQCLSPVLLFNPVFSMMTFILSLVAVLAYVVVGYKKRERATVKDFVLSFAKYELALGVCCGVMLSSTLVSIVMISPAALTYAMSTIANLFLGFGLFFAAGKTLSRNQVSYIQGMGAMMLLFGLIGGLIIGGLFVITGLTGVAILPYIVEISYAVSIALVLLGDLYVILSRQGDDEQAPMVAVLSVFVNTIDLAVSLAKAYILREKSKRSDNRLSSEGIKQVAIGSVCVAGLGCLLYNAFKGDLVPDKNNRSECFSH